MSVDGRVAVLLSKLGASRRRESAEMTELEDMLRFQLETAHTQWPTVALDDNAYLEHLANKLKERATEPLQQVLETLPAADLYLAAACAEGMSSAIETFRQAFLPDLRVSLAKVGIADSIIDETEQELMLTLFVPQSGEAQIAQYGGRGRLRSWLRSVGVRTARHLMGSLRAQGSDEEIEHLESEMRDPELELVRTRYGDQVRKAFAAALLGLAGRQRNILRQYYIDRLTIDQLAALYRVNRATAARWVIAARTAILDTTREKLKSELAMSNSEVDSLIRLVRSQLEISLRELEPVKNEPSE